MGIWKIDNVSSEEWQRRQMRRYNIKQWSLVILEIALIIGFVVGMWHVYTWAGDVMHP